MTNEEKVKRMTVFMKRMPPPVGFNAYSVLEVYEAWEESGIVDVMMTREEIENPEHREVINEAVWGEDA